VLFEALIGGLLLISPQTDITTNFYRCLMALTYRTIKAAKEKDYKLAHERGLYLLVTKACSKFFKLKYRVHDQEKNYSLPFDFYY
jgi:hypothetical protein